MSKKLSDILNEKAGFDETRFATLIRAGLFDAKKLPLLKRLLNKEETKLTPNEKNLLLNLLDNLIGRVTSSNAVYNQLKMNVTEETITMQAPPVLVLKRRAMRAYPDGQIVALYYNDKLDRFITIPFSGIGISEKIEAFRESLSEENQEVFDFIIENFPEKIEELIG